MDNEILLEQLAVVSSTIKKDGRKPMSDDNCIVAPFCETIELIFRKGLKRGLAQIGLKECDYWNCLEGLLTSTKIERGIPASIRSIISIIQQSDKVQTCVGKGRLFIRIALVKGLLAMTMESLLLNQKYLRYWYNGTSPFLDKNHTDCIIGIIKTLDHIKFNLKLTTCSFLHENWIIPEVKKLEIIPCDKLGLTVCCVQGKCIIAEVQAGSIAHEYGLVDGDCLDEMCGIHVNEKLSGQMSTIMKANRGQPISAIVIKGKFTDGRWFAPLQRRFKLKGHLKSNGSRSQQNQTAQATQNDINKVNSSRSTFHVTFIAKVNVGKDGSSRIVQDGIQKAVQADTPEKTEMQDVQISLAERDIILSNCHGKVICKFSYTETSSCGIGDNDPELFGFITGDTTCSFANNFVCHVFRSQNADVAQQIITGIGKGFNRTLYCV